MKRMTWPIFCIVVLLTTLPGLLRAEPDRIRLHVNEGRFLTLGQEVTEILITNPNVADVQLTQHSGLMIYGKKTGVTQIVALTKGNQVLFDHKIEVIPDLERLRKLIQQDLGEASVRLDWVSDRMLLSGKVGSVEQMEMILNLAGGALTDEQKLVNNLRVSAVAQVNLKVRIMEMNRRETENLGLNWDILFNPGSMAINLISGRAPLFSDQGTVISGIGLLEGGSATAARTASGNISVGAVLDALAEQNLVTVLAEPNLTSRSGETASFFAGGEFPIPVATTDDNVRIEFKQFGVILDMTPTVLADQRIRLHIKPEVSELTSIGAVKLGGIAIPGVAARRTEATIELSSGQSFAVAGLLQNQRKDLIREVPWLAEIDVLGPLFKSREYQNSETELVVIATANIVEPVDQDIFKDPAGEAYQDGAVIYPKHPGGLIGPRGLTLMEVHD
ncbi:type II and III secretion system protein family protein [Sneathiella glossodoripedis]|uniref:type II and III secretion system protein family protein n=1 Tax=Sneathiella glossodoripedis TaxID=418853 RepID=UPI0004725456|nr:type II and III secretion system protein family protein [Sneathiella glossodoripedis]